MTRHSSRIDYTDGGVVVVRSEIPGNLWLLVTKYADQNKLKPIQAWWLLLSRITNLIDSGDYEFLGPEFETCLNQLATNNEIGTHGLPAVSEHLHKLHRSNKVKSGFVGVYANGKGFVARGPNQCSIGTYKTTEQAALARYLYYRQHKLPYGELSELIEFVDSFAPGVGLETKLELINQEQDIKKRPHHYTLEELKEVMPDEETQDSEIIPFGGVPVEIFDQMNQKGDK